MSATPTEAELELEATHAVEPPPAEMESYYDQEHASMTLIDAMATIGQTFQRGGNYGPYGNYELVVVRTYAID